MAAFGPPLHFVEPKFDKADPSAVASYEASQHAYLSASGTLTQFNAIVSAIHAAAVTYNSGVLRLAIVSALLLHVVAAFVLCWAARPVSRVPYAGAKMVLAQSRALAEDTFKNYRRGWRMTMVALCVSSAALLLYVLGEFGVKLPSVPLLEMPRNT